MKCGREWGRDRKKQRLETVDEAVVLRSFERRKGEVAVEENTA